MILIANAAAIPTVVIRVICLSVMFLPFCPNDRHHATARSATAHACLGWQFSIVSMHAASQGHRITMTLGMLCRPRPWLHVLAAPVGGGLVLSIPLTRRVSCQHLERGVLCTILNPSCRCATHTGQRKAMNACDLYELTLSVSPLANIHVPDISSFHPANVCVVLCGFCWKIQTNSVTIHPKNATSQTILGH